MGFIPDFTPKAFGDFTVADAAIDKLAVDKGISTEAPQVQAAKKTIRLVHEFHKGFKLMYDGGDEAEAIKLLDAAGQKMAELRPDINEIDRMVIAGLVSGVAVAVSPEQLSRGQGYGFI